MRDIGKNLKLLRQAKNMTQEELADALFVTRQTVSNYENGRSRPDVDMLIKIAQILQTDVNTLIYGPAMPKNKKRSYLWLGISGGVFLLSTAVYILISQLLPKSVIGWQHSVKIVLKLAVLPIIMFSLGWVLTHCLSIFGNLQQLPREKTKVLRAIFCVLLVLLVLIPIPMIVFDGIAGYRSYVYKNVSMSFPSIPVYTQAYMLIHRIIFKMPYVYMIVGSISWLFGIPRIHNKTEDEKSVPQ